MLNLLDCARPLQQTDILRKVLGDEFKHGMPIPIPDDLSVLQSLALQKELELWRRKQSVQLFSVNELLLDKVQPPQPLWGRYFAKGQLAIMAGDIGIGKSLFALQLAKHIALGKAFAEHENVCGAQRVLYAGFDLEDNAVTQRLGYVDDKLPNLFVANITTYDIDSVLEKLKKCIESTEAEVLIFDQPGRMHPSPKQWQQLMDALVKWKIEKKLSILLTVDNKPRHTKRPLGLTDIYRHRLLTVYADTVVSIGRVEDREEERYLKVLKSRNTPSPSLQNPTPTPPLEGRGFNNSVCRFEIDCDKNNLLDVVNRGEVDEVDLLPLSKAREKELMKIEAEGMFRSGYMVEQIGYRLEVSESTVRRWVRLVNSEKLKGNNGSENVSLLEGHACRQAGVPECNEGEGGFTAKTSPAVASLGTPSMRGTLQK